MMEFFLSLFAWMPPPLPVLCGGAVVIFFVISFLHLFAFILDLIPFV